MRNIGKKRKEEEGNGSLFKTERGKDFFTFQSRASVPQQKFLETGEPSALLQECSVLHAGLEFTAPALSRCLSLVKNKLAAQWICSYGNCLAHKVKSTGKIELFHLLFIFPFLWITRSAW